MYSIIAYDSPTNSVGKVIFNVATNKLVSAGKLTLKESDIDDFQLSINQNNPLFGRVKPLQTHIIVKQDNTILFKGRALSPKREMTSSGQFVQSFSFESILAYLLDSTQRFKEVHNTSPADFFRLLITAHNSQVPAYKQFKVGDVDVTNSTDNVYRFIDYANTYNTIKDKLISRLGGFLRVRIEPDGNYIDYLKDPGKEHATDNPIKVGHNLKSASVEIDPTNVITRFIPLGATIESVNPNGETNTANPRITIASVNGGKDYIDIPELQAVFGVINGTNVWDDVHTPEILKPKAEQWIKDQMTAEEHWTIGAVETGLDRFKTFNVSDSYQFINPAVAEPQLLRITQKVIDVFSPHSSSLTIGDKKKTLTQYQSDALNATKQVDVLRGRVAAQTAKIVTISNEMKTTNEALSSAQKELSSLKTEYDKLIENIGDTDFKAIIAKLTELENQTTTIINNIGEIGTSVVDLQTFKTEQLAINTAQTTSINDLKADSSSFKSQFTTVNNTLGKHTTDISSLQVTSKELTSGFNTLTSDNTTNKNDISQLKQTATEVSSTLETVQTQVQNSAVGTNLLINTSNSATNGQTTMQGASTDIYGVYSRTDSYEQVIASDIAELYYRFMVPDTNNLYGLTPGETYTLSGSGSHTSGELNFRAQYGTTGNRWSPNYRSDLGIPVSDESVFTPFSYTFTIPVGATGVYISLENYDYTVGDLFRFKNMKLEKGSKATDWCPNPADNATVTALSKLSQTVDSMKYDNEAQAVINKDFEKRIAALEQGGNTSDKR